MGKLSIVATPIGNLEDITLRALRVLKEADLILCEDTRVTKKLLTHYSITTSTLSYHAHSGETKVEKIAELLRAGKNLALVVDAGTPGISDPGGELVTAVRLKLPEIIVEAVPGPSALVAALSVCGIKATRFTFYGFLPHKKGRETLFRRISSAEEASVFYESTHRIEKTLASLKEKVPERRVSLCKEITKVFEEVMIGTPAEILSRLALDHKKKKGEFVVIVEEK